MVFGTLKDDLGTAIEETGWTDGIETGEDVLDGQHRKYFNFVNDYLGTATTRNYERQDHDLVDRMDFLIGYAMEHFATEQKIMKQAGYPRFQEHFEEHMYFLKHVESLRKAIKEVGNNDGLTREVRFYTLEWFVQHILSSDMKMVEFLKQTSTRVSEL